MLISVLDVPIPAVAAGHVLDQLTELPSRVPRHPCLSTIAEVGLDGAHPFLKWVGTPGEPLDAAIRAYGPAAIVDALPRLAALAEALDLVADRGFWHGAIEPSVILVSVDRTTLVGVGVRQTLEVAEASLRQTRWTAPEIVAGEMSTPAADQFGLAAVAYLWLFGDAPQDAVVNQTRGQVGVDSVGLAEVFTCALSPDPALRYDSCTAFVHALERVALPVAAGADPGTLAAATAPVRRSVRDADLPLAPMPLDRPMFGGASEAPRDVASSWSRAAALVALGLGVGFGAGWLVRTWFAPTAEPVAVASRAPDRQAGLTDPATATEVPVARVDPAPLDSPPDAAPAGAAVAPVDPDAFVARPAADTGADRARLLIRSSPSGAAVTIDGVARGTTPLAVRDLPMGTRTVRLVRPGFRAAERRVTLTDDRPSRSVEVSLVADRPAGPAPVSAPAASAGTLVAESRPTGAVVTLDGRVVGKTPLALESVAPGRYGVRLEYAGYRPWETTIEIRAGERARVAASLLGGQQQE